MRNDVVHEVNRMRNPMPEMTGVMTGVVMNVLDNDPAADGEQGQHQLAPGTAETGTELPSIVFAEAIVSSLAFDPDELPSQ